jgi:hypothetical protein
MLVLVSVGTLRPLLFFIHVLFWIHSAKVTSYFFRSEHPLIPIRDCTRRAHSQIQRGLKMACYAAPQYLTTYPEYYVRNTRFTFSRKIALGCTRSRESPIARDARYSLPRLDRSGAHQ